MKVPRRRTAVKDVDAAFFKARYPNRIRVSLTHQCGTALEEIVVFMAAEPARSFMSASLRIRRPSGSASSLRIARGRLTLSEEIHVAPCSRAELCPASEYRPQRSRMEVWQGAVVKAVEKTDDPLQLMEAIEE